MQAVPTGSAGALPSHTAASSVSWTGTYPSSDSWFPSVANYFANRGLPEWVWMPIMLAESGGSPTAGTSGGRLLTGHNSVGLFQLNVHGGQGSGHSVSSLTNPLTNAELAYPAIHSAYQQVIATDAATRNAMTQGQILDRVAQLSGHAGLTMSQYGDRLPKVFSALNSGTAYDGFRFVGKGATLGSGVNPNAYNPAAGLQSLFSGAESWLSKELLYILAIVLVAVVGMIILWKQLGSPPLPIPVPV